MADLLPCPFCGGVAAYSLEHSAVKCSNEDSCGAIGSQRGSSSMAAYAWNRRPVPAPGSPTYPAEQIDLMSAAAFDDIEVDSDGFCRWSEVANALDRMRREIRAVPARSAAMKVDVSVFDRRVKFAEDWSAEPTLRELVLAYYREHAPNDADSIAETYLNGLAALYAAAPDTTANIVEPVAWQCLDKFGRWINMPGDWHPSENVKGYEYRPLFAAFGSGAWREIDCDTPRDREILAVRVEWWTPQNGDNRWIYSKVRQTRWDKDRQRFDFGCEKQPTHWTEVPAVPALPVPRNDGGGSDV